MSRKLDLLNSRLATSKNIIQDINDSMGIIKSELSVALNENDFSALPKTAAKLKFLAGTFEALANIALAESDEIEDLKEMVAADDDEYFEESDDDHHNRG